jgi:hypothetical protein
MATSVRFKLNSAGMREMLKSSGIAADMHRRAEQVAAAARSSAPVESGDYRASIIVTDEMQATRAVSTVGATVEYAPIVEARLGVLGRALDAAR